MTDPARRTSLPLHLSLGARSSSAAWSRLDASLEVYRPELFAGFSESTGPLPWYGDYTKVRAVGQ